MKNKKRVKFSISFKFITIFSIILFLFFSVSTFMVFYFVGNDLVEKEELNNMEVNDLVSLNVQTSFQEIQSSVNGYLNAVMLFQDDVLYENKANLLFNDLCYRTPQVKFVYTPATGVFTENKFLEAHPEVQEVFILWLEKQDTLKKKVTAGRPQIKNISSLYNQGVICLLFPFQNPKTKQNEVVAVGIDEKQLKSILETSPNNSSFVITEEGICIIDPKDDKVLSAADYSTQPFVSQLIKNRSKTSNGNYKDVDSTVTSYYNANSILGNTMYVVTYFVPTETLSEISKLVFRVILVGVFIYFLGIFIILIFSRRIAKTIERLVYITERVGQRDYSTKLKPSSKDEVGYLTKSVNQMQDSLRNLQAQNFKYEKYSNKMIAQKAISEELYIKGVNRNATVLYANIKDFEKFTENQEGPETISFLNAWYEKVESCVEKTGGYIDNLYGDSFLIVWGTVATSENPVTDAWNAVRCALLLRIAAYEVNLKQKAKNLPLMELCCGLSSGVVTAGEIGFSQRADYTILGSIVSEAKQIRNKGKFTGTDVILSKSSYDLVCGKIIAEKLEDSSEKPVYALINAIGLKGPADFNSLKMFLAGQERK